MPKIVRNRLTTAFCKAAPAGSHVDGRGLMLRVDRRGSRRWILRIAVRGKRTDIGLGGFPDVPLARARELTMEYRRIAKEGGDPLAIRRRRKMGVEVPTFAECTKIYIDAHESSWSNDKHRREWPATLERYAFPAFGNVPVDEVDTELVLRSLKPIWMQKPQTASRVRGRIEAVLDLAKARGWRVGENPAAWRGHLALLLPAPSKVAKIRHHAALDYREIPSLLADLEALESIPAKALSFLVLTAARSSEARLARWSEIDLDAGVWTVPAERMKNRREHRVPLSPPALDLLRSLPRVCDLVFPGARYELPFADTVMSRLLGKLRPGMTVHGLRSSFRDFAAEQTSFPRETCEAALAHLNLDKTESAYLRSDLFDKRRDLMNAWAHWCYPKKSPNIVELKAN